MAGMKMIYAMFALVALAGAAFAQMEDFSGAEELIDSGIACEQLTADQLELLGDYYMEQIHPGEQHEVMDAMMGGEGSESLRQMHISMGLRFYCGVGGYGMMGPGMMYGGQAGNAYYGSGMMGGNAGAYGGYGIMGPGMMYGGTPVAGYGMMGGPAYYGAGAFDGTQNFLYVVVIALAIVAAGALVARALEKKGKGEGRRGRKKI